ncbi:Sporulation protein RMD8 like [Verticillium longisporum]|nr:Sporulation protein RMD8 like [Verticillium longisporum]
MPRHILADLTFAENDSGQSLLTRPLNEEDFETEEFHFEYSENIKRPRIFNDMITLLPRSDHMIKLSISHAIAQSTKLCLFEERMSETMLDAQHVPKRLALTGELNMTRTEILKILGRLFKSRVDINLSSNILDVPNFFWDSEPTLNPLYVAIREYLEIDPRIKVLNERCRVFLDLAEILSDSVADSKMSYITWIVIILIVISILVTLTEVGLRFILLSKNSDEGGKKPGETAVRMLLDVPQVDVGVGGLAGELQGKNVTIEDVRRASEVPSSLLRLVAFYTCLFLRTWMYPSDVSVVHVRKRNITFRLLTAGAQPLEQVSDPVNQAEEARGLGAAATALDEGVVHPGRTRPELEKQAAHDDTDAAARHGSTSSHGVEVEAEGQEEAHGKGEAD